MTYSADTYREKRERVLGVRKRGLSFGLIAVAVSLVIIIGLGAVGLPKALTWLQTRNLDDAIFRRHDGNPWPPDVTEKLERIGGVKHAITDRKGTRLVVTFDRRTADVRAIVAHLLSRGLVADLLNQIPHQSNMAAHESTGGEKL